MKYYQGVDGTLWKVDNGQTWFRDKRLVWEPYPADCEEIIRIGIRLGNLKEIVAPVPVKTDVEPWDNDNSK